MGRDKATLPFGTTTLLGRVLLALAPAVDEVAVVARRGQDLGALPALGPVRLRVVHDEAEGLGPLGGLGPGLKALEAPVAFASSCDVPFLSTALVQAMFDALGGADVAIAESGGFLHPLCAVYRTSTAPAVEALLAEGKRRPVDLLARLPHVRVGEAALRAADPSLASLDNLNAPGDYERAVARLASPTGRGS
jgi:molybdopterin-guanine dinucleotide biosynthesis protein A